MSNLKFITITTVMGLSLGYCLHLYHGDRNLCEHVQPSTKLFHFVATFNGLSLLGRSVVGRWQWSGIGLAFLQGYGFAWYSHFVHEQNKPATWQYPWLSYKSDNKLFLQSLLGMHKLW